MSIFGAYGGWPRTFGGAPSMIEAEHMAMLDALAPGWDVQPGTDVYNEAYAHAVSLSIGWACNARLRNQALPMRMQEALYDWETATSQRQPGNATLQARRRTVAAKLRGYAGNTLGDIRDVCSAVFGSHFVDVRTVAPGDEIVYWPGGAPSYADDGTAVFATPGPPGFEWWTNRCAIGVEVSNVGISSADFKARMAMLSDTLTVLLPSWMTFVIGIGSGVEGVTGFICDVGICDLTLL